MDEGARLAAARQLRALAIEFMARSHDAQAGLIRAFESAAAPLSLEVGDVSIEDDDDEALALTAAGRFRGSALDDETAAWRTLDGPDDVADFYDPVDLFDDLAGAIEDLFPLLADEDVEAASPTPSAAPSRSQPSPSNDPWLARMARPGPGGDGPPPESASMTILRDLHAAGVFSDEEFAARKAKLEAS